MTTETKREPVATLRFDESDGDFLSALSEYKQCTKKDIIRESAFKFLRDSQDIKHWNTAFNSYETNPETYSLFSLEEKGIL